MNATEAIKRLRQPMMAATGGVECIKPRFVPASLSRLEELKIADLIETLERERDEARAAYVYLREFASDETNAELLEDLDASHPDRPEWRKVGNNGT